MCGIIGITGKDSKERENKINTGLEILKNRGKDGLGIFSKGDVTIGHRLHSVVGKVKQPFLDEKNVFAANCEIYNWKILGEGRNDAEVLFKLIAKEGMKALDKVDGVYAFAYFDGEKLYLARDILGEKPLWYSHSLGFAFASEKKALEKMGFLDVIELNPRKILCYDVKNDKIKFIEREFFSLGEIKKKKEVIEKEVFGLVTDAIAKRIPDMKFGILFSGGIDSTVIAKICKELGVEFTCYVAALEEEGLKKAEDMEYAEKAAKEYGFKLKKVKVKLADVENYLKKVVPLIEDNNVVKAGVATVFYAACEQASKDSIKVIFSGLGSEEIFAGYERHKKSSDINKECYSGLLKMYERDLYRDDVVSMYQGIELRLPFLDKRLVEYALKIPVKHKIEGEMGKMILRQAAHKFLGIKKEFAFRKKRAAQYGSRFDSAIEKLAKRKGFRFKSEYLKEFYPSHNLNLCAMVSGGKDSIYAMHVMMRQNYNVKCMVALMSKNPASYMFHTPNMNIVREQSKAMEIPLIEQQTEGEKEEELKDLKKALLSAKEKYKIEGVITGALYSNYQRERIEKICDSLGLKIFSPLWHINQESEVLELLDEGFEVIMASVAALGLDKTWLGKKIDKSMVKKLVELNRKTGINVAGEGGEYETLVLDGPMFKKRIEVVEAEKIVEGENTGLYRVNKVKLVKK